MTAALIALPFIVMGLDILFSTYDIRRNRRELNLFRALAAEAAEQNRRLTIRTAGFDAVRRAVL